MKRLIWGLCSSVLVIASLLTAFPLPAAAATPPPSEGFNIITSPLPIKLSTEPGRTVTADLRMKNLGTQPETIKVGLMKFGATGEIGQPNLFDLTSRDTYAQWVHFTPSQFVAEPNVWKTVHMSIDVPSDASLGYYLAVTFSRAAQTGEKNATSVKGSVATLVLLEVKNANEKRSLQLVDFTTNHGLYEYLPITFNVKIHNNGNIYIAPTGNIFIQRGNTAVSTINFNEAGGSVLPNSNRILKVSWSSGFPVFKDRLKDGKPIPDKHANPQQDLKWDFSQASKFRIGRYTAKLLVVYNDGMHDVPVESAVSFWVLPWKLLFGLLVVLAILGLGLWGVVRSFIRSAKSTSSKYRKDGKE